MNTNAFAKGDALAKLIELIGADNKAFKAQDAELLVAIDEVRDMFNTDELTVLNLWSELQTLAQAGNLEPGHKYKLKQGITIRGIKLVNIIVSAKSNSELESLAVADGCLVYMAPNGAFTNAVRISDLMKLVTEGSKDSFAGTNDVDTLTDLPVNKSTINAEVSTDQALSWEEDLESGREVLVVIHNTGNSDINITLPENCNEATLTIPAGEYTEASVVSINGTYYTRVPSTSGGTGGVAYDEITADDIQAMFADS